MKAEQNHVLQWKRQIELIEYINALDENYLYCYKQYENISKNEMIKILKSYNKIHYFDHYITPIDENVIMITMLTEEN